MSAFRVGVRGRTASAISLRLGLASMLEPRGIRHVSIEAVVEHPQRKRARSTDPVVR